MNMLLNMAKSKIMKMVQYGGAVFSRFCPKCGEEAKPAKSLSVNRFMMQSINKQSHTVDGECLNHKGIKLAFLGWEADLV